jgi:hypothetical protein
VLRPRFERAYETLLVDAPVLLQAGIVLCALEVRWFSAFVLVMLP